MIPSSFIGNLTPGGAGGAEAGEKTVYFGVDTLSSQGDYRVRPIAGAGNFDFNFAIPDDFNTLISLELLGHSNDDFTDEEIDLSSNYYNPEAAENFQQHVESDTTGVFSGTEDDGFVLDLSSVFSAIAAKDSCGVNVDHKSIGATIYYKHVKLVYR